MSKPKSKSHNGAHRYNLVLWGKKQTPIYKCVKPDCNHYKELALAVGALNECNRCLSVVHPITKDDILRRRVKPHCGPCTKGYKGKKTKVEEAGDVMLHLDALLNLED